MKFIKLEWGAWNTRAMLIYGISSFLAFGPLQLLLHNNEYQNSIFTNSPFLYFMTQGLFVALFSTGFVRLVTWIVKRRRGKDIQ